MQSSAGCHDLIDPVGFGFENYDLVGRYRTMDGDHQVDASGRLVQTQDIDGPFNGAVELANRLAQSQQVQDCVADNWFVFAFGRSGTNDLDACSRDRLLKAFRQSNGNIRALVVALAQTRAFRYRRVVAPE